MKVTELDPNFVDRAFFATKAYVSVPTRAGCYMIANVVDDIIYIGQSMNLRQRFGQHLDDERMTGQTEKGLCHWFYYFPMPMHSLGETEMSLLSLYKFHVGSLPPLNRIGP